MRDQTGVTPAIDLGPRRSAIFTANNPIIGYRRNGRPIRVIAGGSGDTSAADPPAPGTGDDTGGSTSGDSTSGDSGDTSAEDAEAEALLADALGRGDDRLPDDHPAAVALRKANAEAAKHRAKVKEYEDRDKTELQRAAERAETAEKAAADANTKVIRYRVAAKNGISDEDADLFLTGSDEDTITKQAERYAELSKSNGTGDDKTPPGYVPRSGTGGGTGSAGTVAAGRELYNSSRSADREKEGTNA